MNQYYETKSGERIHAKLINRHLILCYGRDSIAFTVPGSIAGRIRHALKRKDWHVISPLIDHCTMAP